MADDFELLVDGRPVAEAPARSPTVIETDQEFNGASRIAIAELNETQIANLAMLAKVWGFVKYHHPAITTGARHWDYDLFRLMPRVLAAADGATASKAIQDWISAIGPVAACSPCAALPSGKLYLAPNLDWIADENRLRAELSQTLRNIHGNRRVQTQQFYVSPFPNVLNPQFDNEPAYPGIRYPDAAYQLLALFRYWNMVEYFSPYRDIMSDDPANEPHYWQNVLAEFIPRLALARTALAYQQEMIQFIARIRDTHANLWSSLAARPPIGTCQLPVDIRFVEGKPIILRHTSATAGPASGLRPGDLIEELDGVPVTELLERWRTFYAASNEPTRLRDIGNYMTRGACGGARVMVSRGEEMLNLTPNRVPINTLDFSRTNVHDRPGPAFQMIEPDIAYVKISTARSADAASYVRNSSGTKGMIIDIRNYPSDFPIFALGQLLVSQPTPFAQFTNPDMTNPGAIVWGPVLSLSPAQPRYSGKVVILVDEVTQSSAEYHSMAFRRAPGALVIGSTTAGADGNVSTIPLPGGLSSYITGLGVFYPDGTPTQRIGIIPDVEVKPTIVGIRAGRDELVEAAIRLIREEPKAGSSPNAR